MDFLVLKLRAPLMSFGGPMVDQNGVCQDFPSLSLLTGLLGNALGYEHPEAERLGALQARIRYGVRQDRAGTRLLDYQTVDLGQPHMAAEHVGWTTMGRIESRGGSISKGTHIRRREYLADATYTVVLHLVPDAATPTLDELEAALTSPARPLFIGRKTCLPSAPLLAGRVRAATLLAALKTAALPSGHDELAAAWWPDEEGGPAESRTLLVRDRRDWANQVHVGERRLRHGVITLQEVSP